MAIVADLVVYLLRKRMRLVDRTTRRRLLPHEGKTVDVTSAVIAVPLLLHPIGPLRSDDVSMDNGMRSEGSRQKHSRKTIIHCDPAEGQLRCMLPFEA